MSKVNHGELGSIAVDVYKPLEDRKNLNDWISKGGKDSSSNIGVSRRLKKR